MTPIARLRGTRDLLPAGETAWRWLHDAHRRVAEGFGYRLIDTPILEATELFSRGVGAGTDVVDKEMYTFADRAGRSVTLRPEGTAGVLRAVLDAHLTDSLGCVRVHYAGPMFRYDRPQQGRYRQFSTVGIECVGESAPSIDAETVEVGWALFRELGLDGVSLQVNSLGDADDRRRYRRELHDHLSPHAGQLCDDCRRRLEVNPLRVLDCKRDRELVAGAPPIVGSLGPDSRRRFEKVLTLISAAGIPVELNPRLVRGLDYYGHTAFEFWHVSLEGAQNALGGGGRYDGLAEVIGRRPAPGAGYGLGVERILHVADAAGILPAPASSCDAVVASLGDGSVPPAAAAARALRGAGVRTVLDGGDRRLERKLRDADRLGARLAVIVGEQEVARGVAALRDLARRGQRDVALDGLAAAAAAALEGDGPPEAEVDAVPGDRSAAL